MFIEKIDDGVPSKKAIERLSKTVIAYALRDNVKKVRFEPNGKVKPTSMGWKVDFQINNIWQEQMRLPNYVRDAVVEYYRVWFGENNIVILRFEERQRHIVLCYKITASWKSEQQTEDLILTIEHDVSTELNEYSKWI